MTTPRRTNSQVLLNCAVKTCADQGCDTECYFYGKGSSPFGVTFIPGSGKLSEFPSLLDNIIKPDDSSSLIDTIKNINNCPKEFPPTTICISDCTEFAAIAPINFINGDLIIGSSEISAQVATGILQILPPPNNDAIDIFPNLLGINGSLYIVGTQYRRISGFDKLRFVTGSIVIVNNPDLISIPTFPSLLTIGGQIINIHQGPSEEIILMDNLEDIKVNAMVPLEDPRCGKGTLIIANNNSLRKITGFEALRQVKDGIFIANNTCLVHICGFIHLYRTDRIVISRNSKLNKIIGFCYTDTINIGLFILDNNLDGEFDLTISAFVALETAGKVVVIGNNGLKVLIFNALKIVIKELIIRSNNQLDEFSSSVEFVSDLFIENNKSLYIIKLPCLHEVNFVMNINANCSLICLDTFDELRRVGHGIIIADNKQLVELKGFNKLKYIGSKCITPSSVQQPNPCNGCDCVTTVTFDWETIIRLPDCIIVDPFIVTAYDSSVNCCAYTISQDFFRLVCNSMPACNTFNIDEEIPDILSYSLIIFKNPRLKAIGGFCNLKHVETIIYIINNVILHTINAYGQLAYALDIWIRNNPSLKFIIGFNNLLSIRDFVVRESPCLCEFNGIKSLEFAQNIAFETKTSRSVKLPKTPIPSVFGYTTYFSYDYKC